MKIVSLNEKFCSVRILFINLTLPYMSHIIGKVSCFLLKCVVPENIHTLPWKGFAAWPPSPLDFPKLAPKIHPPPILNSKIFARPLEILLSLIKVNKEVVLFTKMPNFVSFMYFLLNCITDKRIPYVYSLCTQVTDKFCAFHVISVEFYNSANGMQGHVTNITVLKRSGPHHAIRQCEYRILFYQICIFEFAVKLCVANFIDKKIVTQSLMCWKRLV